MSARSEQLDNRIDGPRAKRWAKRFTVRGERRQAKRDPEDAPRRRVYRGWSS